MAKTIQERLAAALLARGYKELDSKTRKYRTFAGTQDERKLFVGKSGALRVGVNSSTSTSITGHKLYKELLAEQRA